MFSTRPEAGTPTQIAVDRNFRREQAERAKLDIQREKTKRDELAKMRMAHIQDIQKYLDEAHPGGKIVASSEDPWTYEPILFEDLLREFVAGPNAERVMEIRKLISSDSKTSNPKKNLEDFMAIRASEAQHWESRIRSSDPDTSRELHADWTEELEELNAVADAIKNGTTGRNVEEAVRTIENLHMRSWTHLKQLLAIRGLTLADAKSDPAAKYMIAEIKRLRPVRDLLYYRRCYPQLARLANS